MSDQPVRWTPLGNLDKDTEYKLVGKGNYTDALDVIKQDDEGQVSGTIQPTKRNKHAFSLGSVQAQNKKYRVTVSGDATRNHALKFLSTKRDYRITTGTGPNGEVEFNGTISSLQSAFNASNLSGAFQVSVSGNTMEFELTPYPHYQWYLESVGEDDLEVVCIQEAIPTDLAGPLKDIGSYDLLGDLFVFSTTQDNEPTELEAEIIGVGPIGPNPTPPPNSSLVGPLTSLTFNAPHGLQEGQWIRIVDSNAPWLNGLFVVNSVTSTIGVQIVTDTAWGATHPTFVVGQEKVFIHPTGIGEIGVAQKNNSTESWTYTRLLRSIEFNFVSRKAIDILGMNEPDKKSFYFTDNYNPPKTFYHKGEYQTDGLLSYINGLNIYEYDNIFLDTNLQNTGNAVRLTLKEQRSGNGILSPGIKYYTIRQITENGNEALFEFFLGPVPVYMQNGIDTETDENISFDANVGITSNGYITNKSNTISISGLDYYTFKEAELVCVEYVSGVITANIIKRFNVPIDGEYEYSHTGFEEITPIDIGDVIAQSSGIFSSSTVVRAKNIRPVDNRSVLSNITTLSDLDLSEWTRTFRHSLIKDSITASTITEYRDYQIPSNVLDNTGLILYENYRVGCRAYIRGYGWTSYFWVDDIKIDTLSTNSANPLDDRRISGLSDYELSIGSYYPLGDFDPTAPSTAIKSIKESVDTSGNVDPAYYVGIAVDSWNDNYDQSSNKYSADKQLLVPKIEFEIDWSYTISDISNKPLGEIVQALEFGIGDVPKSVKEFGLGVMSCENGSTAGFPDEIFEFPFHPRVKSAEGQFSYNSSTPFNFQSSRTYIPNYPIVSHKMDLSDAPDISQESLISDKRTDVISIYSIDMLISGYENFSDINEATNLIGLGPIKTKKCITGNRQFIQPASLNITDTIGGLEPNPTYYSEFHIGKDQLTQIAEIEDVIKVTDTSDNQFSNGEIYVRWDSYRNITNPTGSITPPFDMGESYEKLSERTPIAVIKTATPLLEYLETEPQLQNRGLFYAVAYKNEIINFPIKERTNYKRIGQTIYLDLNRQPTNVKINGGDAFTTIMYHKNRDQLFSFDALNSQTLQEGSTFSFVSQSRELVAALSCQVEGNPLTSSTLPDQQSNWATYLFPYVKYFFSPSNVFFWEKNNISEWGRPQSIEHTGIDNVSVGTTYNRVYRVLPEYTTNNIIQQRDYPSYTILNLERNFNNTRPTRIIWSDAHIIGSEKDSLRIFLPQAYKDIDLSFGEINHHENINGELFTIQPRKYQLQYFNTRGTLQGSNEGVEVIIGDGSVLARDGQTLSSYGTNHKWSVVKGSSPGGKDVIYWFNQENGLFMRFGADGTVVLSERHGLRSFSANNTRWTENQHVPALNYGIRSVWDDRFKEAIWTFIGVRDSKGKWGTIPSNELYSEGDTVTGSTFGNYPFDGVPDVYISLSNHYPIPQSEPGVGSDWETYWRLADKDDPEYYTVFTLAFNELSNGFSTFYSHIPKTYLKWKNKFLSSHPTERSEIYEHRYGYDKWYEYEGVWKESEPFLEGVVNPFPDQSKKFVAIQSLSDNVPDRIELKTKDHESFLVSTDFDPEDDAWRTPIKNDILTSQTGDPNDDTESLVGAYMRVKFKFFNGAYNKLNNLVVKVRQRLRRTQ